MPGTGMPREVRRLISALSSAGISISASEDPLESVVVVPPARVTGGGVDVAVFLGAERGGKQRGGARVADGGYGVFAELGFYEEEEAREARGGVRGGVRVGGFEALGEVVVGAGGLAVCVRVPVEVGDRAPGDCW